MFRSVKVQILCIFVLISLVHLSQTETDTIKVLKRIEEKLTEFKRKCENEQERIWDFVSLSLKKFEEANQISYREIKASLQKIPKKTEFTCFGLNLTSLLTKEMKTRHEKTQSSVNAKLQMLNDNLNETQIASEQIRVTLDKHIPTFESSLNEQTRLIKSGLPNSCSAAIASGNGPGIYEILISDKVTSVFCDAFGKMMIQHQMKGTEDFFKRPWVDFKNGFGSPHAQYWMGLEYVHLLTSSRRYELHIVVLDFQNGTTQYIYDNFQISDESDMYRIKQLGEYSGDDNRNLLQNHINAPFSTCDKDNNGRLNEGNCAHRYSCGWWYLNEPAKYCSQVNLNQNVRTDSSQYFYYILKWNKGFELQEATMYIKLH